MKDFWMEEPENQRKINKKKDNNCYNSYTYCNIYDNNSISVYIKQRSKAMDR